jgi:hypothetical protein
MANYRGLLWSLVAIAGTATAAAVAYRYVTRGVRPRGDEDDEADAARRRRDGAHSSGDAAATNAAANSAIDEYELLSDDENDGIADDLADAVQSQEQQLVLVAREGNAVRVVLQFPSTEQLRYLIAMCNAFADVVDDGLDNDCDRGAHGCCCRVDE